MEKSKPFFTIGITVYRCEQFLEQCLVSMKTQTYTNFECILVNDGSPGVSEFTDNQDSSWNPEINIQALAKKDQAFEIFKRSVGDDPRFSYIYKENGGVSSARNFFLDAAQGEWLTLVDSDDWCQQTYLEEIKSYIDIADKSIPTIFNYPYTKFYNTGRNISMYYPKRPCILNHVHSSIMYSANTIFHLPTVKEIGLRYDERLGRGSKHAQKISDGGEDFKFSFSFLNHYYQQDIPVKIVVMPEMGYMYREVNRDEKRRLARIESYQYMKKILLPEAKNSSWFLAHIIRVTTFWKWLKTSDVGLVLAKPISLYLRVLTRCY